MSDSSTPRVDETTGAQLARAVERLVDPADAIVRMADAVRRTVRPSADPDRVRRDWCDRVIRSYARRAALSGGAAALPALAPGVGTLIAVAGGAVVDTAYLLKYEVELALALAHIHGHDIATESHRQLGFLLGVEQVRRMRDERVEGPPAPGLLDVARTLGPHELRRMVVSACTRLLAAQVGKGALRALPLAGVAFSASLNHALTLRVGRRLMNELSRREELDELLGGASENIIDVEPRPPS